MPLANRVFRGPHDREPQTVSRNVSGALLPCTFVSLAGVGAVAQATAPAAMLGLLGNRDFYDQDLDQAYVSGEMGVIYRIRPDDDYQVAMAAGTYTVGQELTVAASGRLAAAATGNVVVAFYNDAAQLGALTAGRRADIRIANFYAKP